jgi:hypothetical protein
VDLTPFASLDIQLTFEFDTVDATNNVGEGIYLDDITVFHTQTCGDLNETFDYNTAFNFLRSTTNASEGWTISTYRKYSGVRSLYAGNDAAHSYNYGAGDMKATYGMEICVNGTLEFRLWTLLAETNCNDKFTVEVGNDVLYTQCQNTGNFTLVGVNMGAYANLSVPITFRFKTDGATNGAEGVYLDDVRLICVN